MKVFKKVASTMATLGIVAVLTACGGGGASTDTSKENDTNTSNASENETTEKLEGEIAIDGSSTVFPILEVVSEEYSQVQPGVRAPVGQSGTGGGFKRFVVGETDLSNASRPIKDEEAALAKDNGVEYIELELAYDGLSVVVSKENDFVDYLTVEELQKMWTEEGGVETWADVREGWPAERIEFFSPGTDSGTFDYWSETILDKKDIKKRAQVSSGNNNVLVNGVAGDPHAIGYFGYAYYAENKDKLKIVPVDSGDGPVEPSIETINNGTYKPLSRPVFTYVNLESLKRPEVADYIKFLNENVAELAVEVGYINLPDANYQKNAEKIAEATK